MELHVRIGKKGIVNKTLVLTTLVYHPFQWRRLTYGRHQCRKQVKQHLNHNNIKKNPDDIIKMPQSKISH